MIYHIKDVDAFIKISLKTIAKIIKYKYKTLIKMVTVENVRFLMKKYVKKDQNNNIYISYKNIDKLYADIHEWIIGIELAQMAAEDKIGCYWDNKRNEMIFFNKELGVNDGKTN
jgi:hypothetical protein